MAKAPQAPGTGSDDPGLRKLIEQARADPKFFHDLVYDTEKTITRIDYLTRREKAAILMIDPDRLVAGLIGKVNPGGSVEVCGVSCAGSCGATCMASCVGSCGGSCGGSCESSCGATCGASCAGSCGNSCADSCVGSCVGSGALQNPGDYVTLPESVSEQIVKQIQTQIEGQNFSRFSR